MTIKKVLTAVAVAAGGLTTSLGLASPAGAATEAQAYISVPNYVVWNMRDISICGTLTNPSAVGDGAAAWDMARSQNQSAWSFWYLYQGGARDCGPAFIPGAESSGQPLGEWHAYPDYGDAYQPAPFTENTATFWIEEGSWAGVEAVRSGHYVGLSAWAKYYYDRYNYGTSGAATNWAGHTIYFQRWSGKYWYTVATHRVTSNGWTGKTWVYDSSGAYYRAWAYSTGTIIAASSAHVWR